MSCCVFFLLFIGMSSLSWTTFTYAQVDWKLKVNIHSVGIYNHITEEEEMEAPQDNAIVVQISDFDIMILIKDPEFGGVDIPNLPFIMYIKEHERQSNNIIYYAGETDAGTFEAFLDTQSNSIKIFIHYEDREFDSDIFFLHFFYE